jgi:molecular chaperone DnaK
MEPVSAVLSEAGVAAADVDEVVLVGGSSRLPRVQQQLAAFFGKRPNTSVHPEEAVAEGAAMHAGLLTDSWPVVAAAVERVRSRGAQ